MHLKDLLTSTDVRKADHNLAVKSTWTQQCLVKNIWAVGCCNDDDTIIHIKTIHLNEQLVQRLLTLVMTATETRATLATNRINLINENDARCLLLSLFEHVAHTRGTNTNKHFDEIRA